MKLKLEKSVVIKLAILAALVLAAPFLVPFVAEFIVLADIMGLEAGVLFLVYHARHALAEAVYRVKTATAHFTLTLLSLSDAYILQPKVFVSHSAASSVILVLSCSAALALAIWLPVFYLSAYGGGLI